MKKDKTNDQDQYVMLSVRMPKETARKMRVYLAKADKKMAQWVKEKIEELPDEEEARRYHRKVG